MGCPCSGGAKRQIKPSQKPKRIDHVIGRPVAKTIDVNVKFCSKCGWMMAKVSYIDVNTKKKIQKYTCPNRKCSEYNK